MLTHSRILIQDGGWLGLCFPAAIYNVTLKEQVYFIAMGTEPTKSSSHVEHLLAEIESSDGLLGPTLRWIDINQKLFSSDTSFLRLKFWQEVKEVPSPMIFYNWTLILVTNLEPSTMEKNTLSLWINWRIAYEFTIRTSSGCVTITTKVSSNLLTNCLKFAEKHGNSRYLNVLMSKEWCV